MDPKFVNLLIQQLLNTTTCPKCGSSISPVNVKVESIGKDNCLFKMQCSKCRTVISADAQMTQQNQLNVKKTEPINSSALQKTSEKKATSKSVNLDDLMQMKKEMQKFSGSFKTLLQ